MSRDPYQGEYCPLLLVHEQMIKVLAWLPRARLSILRAGRRILLAVQEESF